MRDLFSFRNLIFFLILVVILGGATVWLLEHNYLSDIVLQRSAKLHGIFDARQLKLENLGLIYPHLPYYLLIPFYFIPGLSPVMAPYLASIFVGAALLVVWQQQLQQRGYGLRFRMAILLVVVAHPYFLWAITSGTVQDALSLVLFYAFYLNISQLASERDIRSFIVLALILATYFFVDERAIFLFIALLPLLPLVAPQRMMKASPVSVYIVITFPFLASVASWAYLNWIFHHDPWLFWNSPESSFRGGWFRAPDVEWLRLYGGTWLLPILISCGYALVSFPVLAWLLARVRRDKVFFAASIVLFLHPLIAIGFGTLKYFVTHPLGMLFLFSSGIMAAIALVPPMGAVARRGVLVAMLMGVVGGWFTLSWNPDPEIERWHDAFLGQHLTPQHQGDLALGMWLRSHRLPTLLDEKGGFRVIVARGDAKGLFLSFSDEFKMAFKYKQPKVSQIAVPNPASLNGGRDMVNKQYPFFFARGMDKYQLVYDDDDWRVYRLRRDERVVAYAD